MELSLVAVFSVVALLGAIAAGASAHFAYVAKSDGTVSVINTQTSEVVKLQNGQDAIEVGDFLSGIAFTPDGRFAYLLRAGGPSGFDGSVSVIDTRTNQMVKLQNGKEAIAVGSQPEGIAITPDGKFAYVTNFLDSSVSVINTQTNEVVTFPNGKDAIKVGAQARRIAITPDGRFAYVADFGSDGVSVINTQTNEVVKLQNGEEAIRVGEEPEGIAITPDGKFAYVADSRNAQNVRGNRVSVINTQTNEVVKLQNGEEAIKVGDEPHSVAISPDGRFAYVANRQGRSVSVINTQTNEVVKLQNGEEAIEFPDSLGGLAFAPDGGFLYVARASSNGAGGFSGSLSAINTQTNEVVKLQNGRDAIAVGGAASAIAITPDQPPVASFTTLRVRPGASAPLDASGSKDPDSTIATYAWSFGDGQSQSFPTATTTHTFAKPGNYAVSLKETDAEGCSTPDTLRFTGQTAYCGGSAKAQITKTIKVSYPGVRIKCPKGTKRKGTKRKGCLFKLQAIAAKPRRGKAPRAESTIAKAKAKAGRSVIVSLKPKPVFAAKLAAASIVLVKETLRTARSTKTRYVKLKIVQ